VRTGSLVKLVTFGNLIHLTNKRRRANPGLDPDKLWPRCGHCVRVRADGRKVYKGVIEVKLVEEDRTSMTVWARCHGKEDCLRIDFQRDVPFEDQAGNRGTERSMAWRGLVFFEPELSR
jgi:hypothetical protein